MDRFGRQQDVRVGIQRRPYGGNPGAARAIPAERMQPSQPGALGPEQGQYVRLPGADFPPAGAIAVDQTGDANIAPAASAILVTIAVPDAYRFRLAGIGFGADDEVALGFLTWSLRLDGDTPPSPSYQVMASAVGSIRQLADLFFVVGSSQALTVLAISDPAAALTYRFICRLRGWFWAEREN
jgi:hypothetical protein